MTEIKLKWPAKFCLFLAGSIAMLFGVAFLITPVILYIIPNSPVNAISILLKGKAFAYTFKSLVLTNWQIFGPLVVMVAAPPAASYVLYRKKRYKLSFLLSGTYLLVLLMRPWK